MALPKTIHTPAELPDPSLFENIEEPWVAVEILVPQVIYRRDFGIDYRPPRDI
jgi:translation elongation factor EF-4